MPLDTAGAMKLWYRYAWCRDNGHAAYVEKADKCDRFFRGDQWELTDLNKLRQQRRPALTINKIISTLSNVMGEQIFNRNEVSYRPRGQDPAATATVLTKLFKHVSDRNQLDWKRSDMFADGAITSRGFLDMRMEFGENMQGESARGDSALVREMRAPAGAGGEWPQALARQCRAALDEVDFLAPWLSLAPLPAELAGAPGKQAVGLAQAGTVECITNRAGVGEMGQFHPPMP